MNLTYQYKGPIDQSPRRLARDARTAWVIMMLYGVLTLVIGGNDVAAALRVAAWPAVEGTIVSTAVQPETVVDRRGQLTRYVAVVNFDYTVNGEVRRGNRAHVWSALDTFENPLLAEQAVRDYAPGQTVTVYYDPDQPSQAALSTEAGLSRGVIVVALGGLLLVGGAIGWIVNRMRPHA